MPVGNKSHTYLNKPAAFKKSMTTGIAQKRCTALFPLWSLRKNDIRKSKKKKTDKEKTCKALKGILSFK